MAGVTFQDVTKSFGRVRALDHLSFTMPSGQLTGFLGPNGAGKSTSFRALMGITRIDGGRIDVLGRSVATDASAVVKQTGAIVEDPGHHRALNGRDNLRVAAATLGHGAEQIDELLSRVGLEDVGNRKVSGYSKGMRQRLGLAAALLGDPDLLILDEPLDGLDPAGQVAFKAALRALVDGDGKTVVISSHDLRDIEELADYVVVIDRGSLVAQGAAADLMRGEPTVRVRVTDPDRATRLLLEAGYRVESDHDDLLVEAHEGSGIAEVLAGGGVFPAALVPETVSLERAFLTLTNTQETP